MIPIDIEVSRLKIKVMLVSQHLVHGITIECFVPEASNLVGR